MPPRAGPVWACSLFIVTGASAELIPLDLAEVPDLMSAFIDVVYDAGSDELGITGFALEIDDGGGPVEQIFSGQFRIDASVNEFGEATTGSLTIQGQVAGLGNLLLTGLLVDFGFEPDGRILEFLFEVTGGDLAPIYTEFHPLVGVILDLGSSSIDWDAGFDNLIGGLTGTGAGVADTSPLPGPSALALLAIAGLLGGRRARASPGLFDGFPQKPC